MSQAAVERCIGRLLTDEDTRARFREAPDDTLTTIADASHDTLTVCERRALLATGGATWDALAARIDPRLQRLARGPGRPLALLVLAGALVIGTGTARAQTEPPAGPGHGPPALVTLADARERALAAIPDLTVQRLERARADAGASGALAAWDPLVRIDGHARTRIDPLNTLFSGAPDGALGPRTTSSGATASWTKLFDTGATVTARASASVDWTNSLLALLTPAYVGSAGIDVRQPLARGRRLDEARHRLRLARIDTTRSRATIERATVAAVAAVEQAYWALVGARQAEAIAARALALAEAQRRDVEVRIEAGVAAEADLATSDAAIAERRTTMIAAGARTEAASIALRSLLTQGATDPWWNAALAASDTELPASPVMVPTADALVTAALAQRPELAELAAIEARADAEAALATDRLRPQVDLVAGYALRGLAGRENGDARLPFASVPIVVDPDLQGAWGQSLRNALGHRFVDASIGVQVTLPVGNRAARADHTAATLARQQVRAQRQALEVAIARDVREARAALRAAQARHAAARDAREAATRQLEAEEVRDAAGTSTAFLLLTRQNDLTRAELAEATARVDEARALTDLDRATGRLLDRRGIQWEDER